MTSTPREDNVRPKTLLACAASVLAASATFGVGATAPAAGQATAPAADRANVSDFLAGQLSGLTGRTTVMVHGTSIAAARQAVAATGMRKTGEFTRIGVVIADATRSQVDAVRSQGGVTYVEGGAQPVDFFSQDLAETSNTATRGAEAAATLTGADGTPLTGKGVSVAVIDSGVDPTHPYFKEADGSSAVVANLKALCEPLTETCSVQRVPAFVDTDTLSVGGHGTHVSGIVAGRPTTLTDGGKLQGAAPGAKLVSISTGAGIVILGADSALNWVLENHEAPCGAGVPASTCPPIKVTNNSYGPTGGGEFDPESATVKLQRALAADGVVTVWAAGNDGGDGSTSLTNPPGQDPTGGILSVAADYLQKTGTRDGVVSEFSSRGLATDASTWPDISAPGENITSSCRLYLAVCSTGLDVRNGPGALDVGTFNTISGTSMAAPHTAEIEQALKVSAHKFTDGAAYQPGPVGTTSYDKGHGLVDVVAAVAALE